MAIKKRVSNHALIKLIIIFSVFILFTSTITLSYQNTANANFLSKPFSSIAKLSAKKASKDRAVNMAEEIVSNYLIEELLGTIDTSVLDQGYAPVCLDTKVNDINDCPVNKRGQIKSQLSDADKAKIDLAVEKRIEAKTLTSQKWQKFLDFFIPIFLANGAVSLISTMLDDDSSSLMDEIAYESLLETSLLKPLVITQYEQIYNFNDYIDTFNVTGIYNGVQNGNFTINYNLKSTKSIKWDYIVKDPNWGNLLNKSVTTNNQGTIVIQLTYLSEIVQNGANLYYPVIYKSPTLVINNISANQAPFNNNVLLTTLDTPSSNPNILSHGFAIDYINDLFSGDANNAFNNLLGYLEPFGYTLVPTIPKIDQVKPTLPSEISDFKPINPNKDKEIKIPGIDYFDYTLPDKTPVKPTPDGDWINQNTGEKIEPDKVEEIQVQPKPDPNTTPDPTKPDLDQLGNNIPKELIFALLDMLRSILDFMVRLMTFVVSIPSIPAIPIPNATVMWFFEVKLLGIHVMDLARTLVISALGMSVYRILKRVF